LAAQWQWVLIADGGGTTVYTKTSTTYTGKGAPHQLIADGASYYDTVKCAPTPSRALLGAGSVDHGQQQHQTLT